MNLVGWYFEPILSLDFWFVSASLCLVLQSTSTLMLSLSTFDGRIERKGQGADSIDALTPYL